LDLRNHHKEFVKIHKRGLDKVVYGIYGIDGLYNYGCEAIIRGMVFILRSISPKCRIIYYSRRAEEDRKQVADIDIDVVQISRNLTLTDRAVNKVFRTLQIMHRVPLDNYKMMCDTAEVIISVGGDIYTIPVYHRVNEKYGYYSNLVQFGEYVKKRNKKLVIFGASIGPFGDYEKAKQYFFNHLKKVDLIVCREKNTMEYLAVNGIKRNLVFYPDPAFFVTGKPIGQESSKRGYIGINLSPLSLREMFGGVSVKQKERLASLISRIAEVTSKNILLIPHVLSPVTQNDNDLSLLIEIYNLLGSEAKSRIQLIDDASGFIQTKLYLRQCDIVIAARMHCAINAICESIPTILVSYSEKSKGIAKYVYGNDNWVLPLDKLETDLLDRINLMIEQRDQLHDYLQKKVEEIRDVEKYKVGINKLSRLISKSAE
jgi:colanic acid/amylovoran biosynthesis protein